MGDKYNQSGKCESCGKPCTFNANKCEVCHRPNRKPQRKASEVFDGSLKKTFEAATDFDLPDVSGGAKAKPRIHRGPDDSTCVSCEG